MVGASRAAPSPLAPPCLNPLSARRRQLVQQLDGAVLRDVRLLVPVEGAGKEGDRVRAELRGAVREDGAAGRAAVRGAPSDAAEARGGRARQVTAPARGKHAKI